MDSTGLMCLSNLPFRNFCEVDVPFFALQRGIWDWRGKTPVPMCYKVARLELELCLPFLKIQVPFTKHGSWALKINLVKCYLCDFRFRFFNPPETRRNNIPQTSFLTSVPLRKKEEGQNPPTCEQRWEMYYITRLWPETIENSHPNWIQYLLII